MDIKYKLLLLILIFSLLLPVPASAKKDLPKGYLLVQLIRTYATTEYGAINRPEAAEKIFITMQGKIDGIEYQTLFFDKRSLQIHKDIALKAQQHGIHLWATTWELLKNISINAFGALNPEYQALKMKPDGTIVPALIQGQPLFDVLNPDAMTWFLKEYKSKYLEPFKGLLNGLFINEDAIPYFGNWGNDVRVDYWANATYSPSVLEQWQRYCIKHNIQFEGKLVDKFPVHRREMVANGNGLTAYFPGYDVPEKIYPGQRFVDLPRAKGVWKHWYDFLSELFLNNWINRIAKMANDVNVDYAEWYGVLYFASFFQALPYEEIQDPAFTVPVKHRWGAWGRQKGIDLAKLSKLPEIDIIVCETFPPIKANIEYYVKEFKRVVDSGGKKYGIMVHADYDWKMELGEEKERWHIIGKYKPHMVVRYPLGNMLPWNKYYDKEVEAYFYHKLAEYRLELK